MPITRSMKMATQHCVEVVEIDILQYLRNVRFELEKSNLPTFVRKISEPNRKPLIRTILGCGGDKSNSKVEFNNRIRELRNRIDYDRLAEYTQTKLLPTLQRLDEKVISEKVPDLFSVIDEILTQNESATLKKQKFNGGASVFNKMGSGRRYRGIVSDMIKDVAPDILEDYFKAAEPIGEWEAIEKAILLWSKQDDDNGEVNDHFHECYGKDSLNEERKNAAFKCLRLVFSPHAESSFSSYEGKLNGFETEQLCVQHLEDIHGDDPDVTVLENVYVNTRTQRGNNSSSSVLRRKNRQQFMGNERKQKGTKTGIIWTHIPRHNTCSEFDAVVVMMHNKASPVVNPKNNTKKDGISSINNKTDHNNVDNVSEMITEVWEAKHVISPSTLFDAFTKKLPALHALMRDKQTSELLYQNGNRRALFFESNDSCIPPPPNYPAGTIFQSKEMLENNSSSGVLFGLFGLKLLPPSNAADQIRAIVASEFVMRDLQAALRAVDTGVIEVSTEIAVQKVVKLSNYLAESLDVEKNCGVRCIVVTHQ